MEKVTLIRIKLSSFIKLLALLGLALGCLVGLFALIVAVLGGSATVWFGETVFTGITAGLIGLIMYPIMFALFGIISALVVYLPFKYMLRLLKGISLTIELADIYGSATEE